MAFDSLETNGDVARLCDGVAVRAVGDVAAAGGSSRLAAGEMRSAWRRDCEEEIGLG